MEMPFESSDLKNPILYPVTRVTSNKSWYLKKYQLCRKYFCIRPCIHSPSTRMGGKSKLRKASLPLVMRLKLDFSSTVTRVTLEWLIRILIFISSYWKNITFSQNCPKFQLFTNIVFLKYHWKKTNCFYLFNLWQGHVRNLLFHFCQLWTGSHY